MPNDISIVKPNFVQVAQPGINENQAQTRDAFSSKWKEIDYEVTKTDRGLEFQKKRYLSLYGFKDEKELYIYLKNCRVVLDAGAGKCKKAAWFAALSPDTIVVAADISNSLVDAASFYKDKKNLFFVQCDISSMPFFKDGNFDYVNCDQVIHHTSDPFETFKELVRVTGIGKELSVYVYRKKALPRELLDDHFREFSKKLSHEQLLDLSEQLASLGKMLDSNKEKIDFPEIPILGIEGGKMTIQRYLYWNFIKCFYNKELGFHNSVMTNYDWYSPSQAFRYTEDEFKSWIKSKHLKETYFIKERASYSGRFLKN